MPPLVGTDVVTGAPVVWIELAISPERLVEVSEENREVVIPSEDRTIEFQQG